jgi:serine/threonine-protein kinase
MPARLRPGSRLAGYVIEERIGVGGMAVVFRARDIALGRTTALKAIAAMRSPHILPVYTAGESDGVLFIAAQFVPGGDLGGLLRRTGGPLEPGHAATLIGQVAAALDAAHAAGLVPS